MKRLKDVAKTTTVNSWKEVLNFVHDLGKAPEDWIFRGMKDTRWDLETSLERTVVRFGRRSRDPKDIRGRRRVLKRQFGPLHYNVRSLESGFLKRFQRQCHHFLTRVPEDDEVLEWLALMQHHGAPTRLLDWTYSFYVALFFAVESADKNCAVWALNREWLIEKVAADHPDLKNFEMNDSYAQSNFHKIFNATPPKSIVYPLNPFRVNQRLMIQQGIFLCPGNVQIPFEDNISSLCVSADCGKNVRLLLIANNSAVRVEILKELHKMNMTHAVLYPGLDGFSRSLHTLMIYPHILRPHGNWPTH